MVIRESGGGLDLWTSWKIRHRYWIVGLQGRLFHSLYFLYSRLKTSELGGGTRDQNRTQWNMHMKYLVSMVADFINFDDILTRRWKRVNLFMGNDRKWNNCINELGNKNRKKLLFVSSVKNEISDHENLLPDVHTAFCPILTSVLFLRFTSFHSWVKGKSKTKSATLKTTIW